MVVVGAGGGSCCRLRGSESGAHLVVLATPLIRYTHTGDSEKINPDGSYKSDTVCYISCVESNKCIN